MIPTPQLRLIAKLLTLTPDGWVDLTGIFPDVAERRALVHEAIRSEPQLQDHTFNAADTFETWSAFYLARFLSREIARRTLAEQGAPIPFANASELLEYLGTDALRWAEQCAARVGGNPSDLLGWFASALETGKSAGREAAARDAAEGVGLGTEFPNLTASPITVHSTDGVLVGKGIGIGPRAEFNPTLTAGGKLELGAGVRVMDFGTNPTRERLEAAGFEHDSEDYRKALAIIEGPAGQPHESDCPDPSDIHATCPEPNNATGAADALTPPGPGEYDVETYQIAPSTADTKRVEDAPRDTFRHGFDVSDAESEAK